MQTITELPQELRLVWRRDRFRCQECGVGVGGRGCKPQTHHIVPRTRGGTDDPANLVTLCFPCHATQIEHLQLLAHMPLELLTDFVKNCTWDLATNLLGCAEAMNPRAFPARAVLRNLRVWRQYLDMIIGEAERVLEEGTRHVVPGDEFDLVDGSTRGVKGVLHGVEKSWFSDVTQQYLDREIVEAKKKWRRELRDD